MNDPAYHERRECPRCDRALPEGWRHEQVPFIPGCVEVALSWLEGADGLPLRDVDGVPMLRLRKRWPS